MQFQKGNKLWQLADPSKVGRPLNFKTPDDLWVKAKEYFNWVDENPIIKTDFKGKDAEKVEYELQRPYTWTGLLISLGVTDLDYYKKKSEFLPILTHIGNIIYTQKFDGAAAGIFNHAIIARDLGLKDNADITTNGKDINSGVDFSQVSDSALLEIARARVKDSNE